MEQAHLPHGSEKGTGVSDPPWWPLFVKALLFLVLSAAFTALLAALVSKTPPGTVLKGWALAAAYLLCAPAGCAAAWGATALVCNRAGGAVNVDPVVEAVRESTDRLAALETELREAPPGADDVVMAALFAERSRLGHLISEARRAGVLAFSRKGRC